MDMKRDIEEMLRVMGPMKSSTIAYNLSQQYKRPVDEREVTNTIQTEMQNLVDMNRTNMQWYLKSVSNTVVSVQNTLRQLVEAHKRVMEEQSVPSSSNPINTPMVPSTTPPITQYAHPPPSSTQSTSIEPLQQWNEANAKNILQYFWHTFYDSQSVPSYQVTSTGPPHNKKFRASVSLPPLSALKIASIDPNIQLPTSTFGEGGTKKEAEKKAAASAVTILQQNRLLVIPKSFCTPPQPTQTFVPSSSSSSQPPSLSPSTSHSSQLQPSVYSASLQPQLASLSHSTTSSSSTPSSQIQPSVYSAPLQPHVPFNSSASSHTTFASSTYSTSQSLSTPIQRLFHVEHKLNSNNTTNPIIHPFNVHQLRTTFTGTADESHRLHPSLLTSLPLQQQPHYLQPSNQRLSQPVLNVQQQQNVTHNVQQTNVSKKRTLEHSKDESTKPVDGGKKKQKKKVEKSTKKRSTKKDKRLVVIDGSNVAMTHGKDKFSSLGLKIAIDYWEARGHPVVAFLPAYVVKNKNPDKLADDVSLIYALIDKKKVVLTPAQDYDDSYIIQYATSHDGVILSNDRFWDWINKSADRDATTTWIREHSCSFTFVNDEFLPNPDFKFPA